MKITDEMVAAAEAAYGQACGGLIPHDRPMRAALEAALGGGSLVDGPDGFEEFWKAYPRKAAKPDGLKAYKTARKFASHAAIMAGVARLVAARGDPQYIPYPASWLRKQGWNDAPVQPALKGIEARQADLRQRIANDYGMERPGSPDPRNAGRLRLERPGSHD